MAFVKLDTGILDSSLWVNRDSRDVFITALLMAQPHEFKEPVEVYEVGSTGSAGWSLEPGWYGFVKAAGPGIVRRADVPREAGALALAALASPDPESRSTGFEGRRMARIDGGWVILNFMRYRDKDHTGAERAKRYRERKKQAVTRDTSHPTRDVTQAEAEAEAEGRSRDQGVARPSGSPKRRPTRPPSGDALGAAQYLYDAIRGHSSTFMADATPATIEAKLVAWARDIDVGMRNDGMTLDGCKSAIDAAHRSEDDFWRSNLLSGGKLRKHYEKLRIRSSKAKPAEQMEGFDYHAFGDRLDGICRTTK